jgi:hypothetical protein
MADQAEQDASVAEQEQDQQEEQPLEQETPMSAPPAPLMPQEQVRPAAPAARPPGMVQGAVQRVITTRDTLLYDPATDTQRYRGRPQTKASVAEKNIADWLDDQVAKPEANNWCIQIRRVLPTHLRDRALPTAQHTCSMMPYDKLQQEITEAWGGGEYRCQICGPDGSVVDNLRAWNISIPTTVYPTKLEIYAQQPGDGPAKAPGDEESEVMKEARRSLKEQAETDLLKERQEQAAQRRAEAELKTMIKKRELTRLERELSRSDDPAAGAAIVQQIERLEARMREERKELEQRLETERRDSAARADADRKAMMEAITKVAEIAAKPQAPADNGLKEILVAMQNAAAQSQAQFTQMLTALLPAMKGDGSQGGLKEVLTAIQTGASASQDRLAQMLTAILPALTAKPDNTANQQVMELIKHNSELALQTANRENSGQQKMIASLLEATVSRSNQQTQAMTPEAVLKIMELGERRLERSFDMYQRLGGGTERGGEEENEGRDEDYDPKLGLLGNAGKALYYGLKKLPELAATYPQVGQLLIGLLGTSRPTDAQMAAKARQMEAQYPGLSGGQRQAALPPPVAQRPIQQMGNVPPPMAPPMSMARPAPMPPPVAAPQPAPSPVPTTPPPVARVNQEQQRIDAETELEGEASGVEPGEINIDEEIAKMAEANLRDAVNSTMMLLLTDMAGNIDKREWPEDATESWHQDFRTALVLAPSDKERVMYLQQMCDPQVWGRVLKAVNDKPEELVKFYRELGRFVELNKGLRADAAALAAPKPTVPVPVPAPTPTTQAVSVPPAQVITLTPESTTTNESVPVQVEVPKPEQQPAPVLVTPPPAAQA